MAARTTTGWPFVTPPSSPPALLPWLALAGLPSDTGATRESRPIHDGALWIGAALPLIAIGAKLDLAAAVPFGHVGLAACAGLLSIAALAYARARAARSSASAALHAIAWLGLVLGAPLLAGIRATGDGASRWLELAASASPLAWALELARSGGVSPDRGALAPVLLVLALAAAASLPWQRREPVQEPA